jgi:hypothetical protein
VKELMEKTDRKLFKFVLYDDSMKEVSIEPHMKLLFRLYFFVICRYISVVLPKNKAIAMATVSDDRFSEFGFISSVPLIDHISHDPILGKIFERRAEYFKRNLCDSIFLHHTSIAVPRQNSNLRWLNANLWTVLQVIFPFLHIFMMSLCRLLY